MKKIGMITVGQSPRSDVTPDLDPILNGAVDRMEIGALDGLTREQIAEFAPRDGDYVLVSRMRDGSSVTFAERYVIPRLQQCIDDLEARGADLILFLCTGVFPEFRSNVPLIFPCDLLYGIVPSLTKHSNIAVITPKQEQIPQSIKKWGEYVATAQVFAATPYGGAPDLERTAGEIARTDADLVVLDCIGFTAEMKRRVAEITGKPAILPRTMAARVIVELLGS